MIVSLKQQPRSEAGKNKVRIIQVHADYAGQRIDNFLQRELKGIPRQLIYRLLRTGRIRVDGKRTKPDFRLAADCVIKLPKLDVKQPAAKVPVSPDQLPPVVHECADFIVVAKPAGLAVHGGSGIRMGLIERMRSASGNERLELAHRIDRDTSGVVAVAKTRVGLKAFHEQLRAGSVRKRYVAAVFGRWSRNKRVIQAPLRKLVPANPGGSRSSIDVVAGKPSTTKTRLREQLKRGALLDLNLVTGRTHQARVHLAHVGLPIIGDQRYGDFAANRMAAAAGHDRMFLHAARLEFVTPTGEPIRVSMRLPAAFASLADWLAYV